MDGTEHLKTYKVVLFVTTFGGENSDGSKTVANFINDEIHKKIAEEHIFLDDKGDVLFFFCSSFPEVEMIRSINASNG